MNSLIQQTLCHALTVVRWAFGRKGFGIFASSAVLKDMGPAPRTSFDSQAASTGDEVVRFTPIHNRDGSNAPAQSFESQMVILLMPLQALAMQGTTPANSYVAPARGTGIWSGNRGTSNAQFEEHRAACAIEDRDAGHSATNVPIIQLSLSTRTLPDTKLNDLGQNIIRPGLAIVHGAEVPDQRVSHQGGRWRGNSPGGLQGAVQNSLSGRDSETGDRKAATH